MCMEILERSLSSWIQVLREYSTLESTNAQLEERCHTLEQQLAEKDRQLQQEIQLRQQAEVQARSHLLEMETWRDRCKDSRQVEDALRISEARYRLFSEISPVGIFQNDARGQCTYANEKTLQITGLTQEEILGDGWGKYLHPEDRDWMYVAWSSFVEQVNSGQDVEYRVELRYLHPDGTLVWVLAQAVPERNTAGEVVGFIGSCTDISEQHAALRDREQSEGTLQKLNEELEERVRARTLELLQTRDFLQTIVDNIPVAVFVKNGREERFGQFLLWNSTCEALFGYTSEQAIGKTVYDFFPEEQSNFFALKDRQSFDRGEIEDIPEEPIDSLTLGKRLLHTIKVPIFDENGDPKYLVCISEDITDRKQAEEALRQANVELEFRVEERTAELKQAKEIAEAANRAKSEFLANVSHELRTPLNGILGYAQILQSSPTLSDRDKGGLDVIYRCGNHLLTLIVDILDLAKIEARKLELSPNEFQFLPLLHDLVDICHIRTEQKGILFSYQPPSDLLNRIFYADEKRLRQVLLNLLGNAIKFTDRGSVTFKVEVVGRETQQTTHGNEYRTKSTIRFEIADTGIGIHPKQLNRILLPFEQSGSCDRKSEGTGLGLAIASNLLEMMGTTLKVRSHYGQGSEFSFELELPEGSTAIEVLDAPSRKIAGYKGNPRKILIVDDQRENRLVFLDLLQPLGFLTGEASSGREGLDRAIEFQPDLIIADLSMTGMDGWEMIRRLRHFPQGESFAIVASSARVSEQDIQRSLAAGADAFLPKPIQTDEFLALIQTHLQLEWIDAETGLAMSQQETEVLEIDETAIAS